MNLMDSFFNIDSFSRLLTFAIFVLAGYDVSKSVPRPKSPFSWIAFILVAIIAGYVGMEVHLISVSGFNVFLNEVILGLAAGFVVGFVIRMRPRFKMR